MRLNMSQVYFLCSFTRLGEVVDHGGATINENLLRVEALGAVARKAIERKTGARDLRSILESIEFALSSMIISSYAGLTRLHEALRTACLQILSESRRDSRTDMAFSGRPTPWGERVLWRYAATVHLSRCGGLKIGVR
jgi:hypothetical protein